MTAYRSYFVELGEVNRYLPLRLQDYKNRIKAGSKLRDGIVELLRSPGTNFKECFCSLADRYDNPIPIRFL